MMDYQTTLSTNRPIAITIGNFDGIHLGHQRLLHEVCAQARALHCTPAMVTFSPHTLQVLRPGSDIRYLTTRDEKLLLAAQYGGVAESIIITFTPEVAAMSAEDFMHDLCTHFSIRGIVAGSDFIFGHQRTGTIEFLQRYGQEHGIALRVISLEEADRTRISSTRIRTLLSQGDIGAANALLGHPTIVSGTVNHGNERGRLLGFPTANLKPDPQKLLPADGVYAVVVHVQNGPGSDSYAASTVYNGVVNIGVRPTFNGKEHLVEVHLLDVTLDLYDRYLTVEFIEHLRGEQRFAGVDALKTQIAADIQKAHQILNVRRVSH